MNTKTLKNQKLSIREARLIALNSQGLLHNDFGKGKQGTLKTIEHLGYVQIDTISVIARAHHHTLWSRLPDYNEKFLNELLAIDKAVFEYWSHAASYLPISDYRFYLPRKKAYAEGKSHWFEQDKEIKNYVLNRIKAEGPLQSKDFEYKRETVANWWEWKPAKKALEQLFMEGTLMISARKGFQKVYDLTERVLPPDIDVSFPEASEYAEHMIHKAVQAHGIINEKEIVYLRSKIKDPVKKALKHLLKEGILTEVFIEGLDTPFVSTIKNLKAIEDLKLKDNVHFLSPFDNIVIQRQRLQNIFGFNYLIECYVPEAKRNYGYFTLPVIYNEQFVARFDPKAERKTKTFFIKSIHFEKDFIPDEKFNILFASKLKSFAKFNGCEKIIIERADIKWKTQIEKYCNTSLFM
jgi:uncharacterized protein YcaQ